MAIPFNRRQIVLGIGILYAAIGLLGFVPGATVATGQAGQVLLFGWLGTSAALGAVHLVLGLIALLASQARVAPRQPLLGLAAAFALLVGGSLVAPVATALGLNGADTVLHLVSLLATAGLGLAEPERATA